MSALRIHLDEDADSYSLLNGLRHRGWDVTSTREQGMRECADEDQLARATSEGRTLFTYNASDFCRLHVEFLGSGRHHAGIIIGDQQTASVGEELRRLIRLGETRMAEDMADTLEFLSNWKV